MELLRISAVSYLNTFPFVYGLKASGLLKNFSLSLEVPSVCAEKLKSGQADIALVPVGALPEIGRYRFISDYCIGATGEVRTVLLLSKVPLERIRKICLDFDSRTSVELVRVLSRHYWHIDPDWENLPPGAAGSAEDVESLVAIGDKTFTIRDRYPYVYDLAEAWINFTGLPFVFAAWISKTSIPVEVSMQFTDALTFGVSHRKESLDYFSDRLPPCNDCLSYLEKNISYSFDDRKKQGLELFLKFLREE